MFLEGYLNKIRQKSKEERNAFAIMLSLGITSVIVFFWIISLVASSGQGNKDAQDSKNSSIASPFEVVRDQFRTVIENKE